MHTVFFSIVMEHLTNFKFCFELGKTATQANKRLLTVYANDVSSHRRASQVKQGRCDRRLHTEQKQLQNVRPLNDPQIDGKSTACKCKPVENLWHYSWRLAKRQVLRKVYSVQPHGCAEGANLIQIRHTKPPFNISIIPGDGSWVFQNNPETKRQSRTWR